MSLLLVVIIIIINMSDYIDEMQPGGVIIVCLAHKQCSGFKSKLRWKQNRLVFLNAVTLVQLAENRYRMLTEL